MANFSRILVIDIETQAAVVETFSLWDAPASIQKIVEPVKVLCFAARWLHEKKMMFFSEWGDGREKMIQAAWELLDAADLVVTWNGRKFDVPHLKYEMLLAGMTPPSPHKDVDLFLVVKSQFNAMSNKLDWYAQQVLNDRKVEHAGMSLWQELRRPASETSLRRARKKMESYNRKDTQLTAELFERLRPWIRELNVLSDSGGAQCLRCGSEDIQWRGVYRASVYWYPRFVCNDCGGWGKGTKSYYHNVLRAV